MRKAKKTLTQRVEELEHQVRMMERNNERNHVRTTGNNFIKTIQAIREHMEMSLIDAKKLAEHLQSRGVLK